MVFQVVSLLLYFQSKDDLSKFKLCDTIKMLCGRGGTGRHVALRSLWGNSRAGSSPVDRTSSWESEVFLPCGGGLRIFCVYRFNGVW